MVHTNTKILQGPSCQAIVSGASLTGPLAAKAKKPLVLQRMMQLSSTQETLQPLCSQSERSPVITGPYFRQVVLVKTADSGIKQYTRMLHVQNRSPNRPDPNIDPRVALIMRCIGILFQAARKVSRWHSSSSQRIAAHRSSVAEKCQVPGVSTKPISWAKVT